MKKNYLLLLVLIIAACNESKKQKSPLDESRLIPVIPFIKSQLSMIDTSLFSVKKIEMTDTLAADTTDIRREDVRVCAKDFLELPDISSEKLKDNYTQTKNFYEDLNLVSFLSLPNNEKANEIKKQEVLISPDSEGSKMYKIIVDREWVTKDSSITKNLIWALDEYFQVVTRKQLPGKPESVHTLKVTWKDFTKSE